MPHRSETPQELPKTAWKCGEPFRYPLPHPEGDPWEVVLEPYLKKDKIRCETWKDEVQTLLIFAGLFSAVVTAFVVDSVKSLQEDSSDLAVVLLARIADRFDSNSTGNLNSNAISSSPAFTPSFTSIRVNILWFISLILSLSTVLVGIVALQWVREHQRYTDGISSKECVAVYHMRAEALERWYVPQVFTGLPLLLQTSLVLFFVGAADYLCTINRTVGIPIAVIVAVTLFFLAATTILPTFQLLILAFRDPSQRPMKIPAQCAYKSPQSWAAHRLFTGMFYLARNIYARWLFPKPYSWSIRWIPIRFCLYNEQHNWITFDSWWLKIRNCYSLFNHNIELDNPRQCLDELAPQHDISEMLKTTIETYTGEADTVLATYHCFQLVSRDASCSDRPVIYTLQDMGFSQRIHLFRHQYWPEYDLISHPRPTIPPGLFIMHEEHLAFFLWSPSRFYPDTLTEKIGAHVLELRCRILEYEFVHNKFRDLGKYQTTLLDPIYQYYMSPLHQVTVGPFHGGLIQHLTISEDVIAASVEHFFVILKAFLKKVFEKDEIWFAQYSQSDEYSLRMVKGFLELPRRMEDDFRLNHNLSSSSSLFRPVLQCLISGFERRSPNHDFLFFCATHFLYDLLPYDALNVGVSLEKDIFSLVGYLAQYESNLQVERHPWTTQESYLWAMTYLWEDADSYRIGTWSKILQEYKASTQLPNNILKIDPTKWYRDNTVPAIRGMTSQLRVDPIIEFEKIEK